MIQLQLAYSRGYIFVNPNLIEYIRLGKDETVLIIYINDKEFLCENSPVNRKELGIWSEE